MKTTLIALLASLLFLTGFCQEPMYNVRVKEIRPLTKETLNKAKTLGDFIPGYPENWISSYVSVEILASYDGKVRKAMGPTEVLTTEQKNILNTVELGAVVVINVNYKYDNLSTNTIDKNQINVSMTVVPEIEAQYVGGLEEMNKYLRKNVTDKISNAYRVSKKLEDGTVMFTVNEEGKVVNIKVSKTSGDPQTDKLLIDTISKMPQWKPAQDSKGVKVKQEFILNAGDAGGC